MTIKQVMVIILSRIKTFFQDYRYKRVRNVFWFMVITLAIHYSYRFWAIHLYYWPVREWMIAWQQQMAAWVFHQSLWVDRHLLGLSTQVSGHTMFFFNGSGIRINQSCAGDKQILQFMLLMIVFPGLWIRKLWYIPMGMVVIYLTNIFRIVLLSLLAIWLPDWMKCLHDSALRGMFYVVIFLLWMIWVEKISPGK